MDILSKLKGLFQSLSSVIKKGIVYGINYLNWYYAPERKLAVIYNINVVENILYKILKENDLALDIIKPNDIGDILPVKYTVLQEENAFQYYKLIIRHPSDTDMELHEFEELLNVKLSQYLQSHYYNYPITYKGMPVLYVFRVEECAYHTSYYAVSIMVIDSVDKINYIHLLTNENRNINTIPSVNDEDF